MLPALQLLVYPVTNHAFETASMREYTRESSPAIPLTADTMRWFWEHYIGGTRGGEVSRWAAADVIARPCPNRATSKFSLPSR